MADNHSAVPSQRSGGRFASFLQSKAKIVVIGWVLAVAFAGGAATQLDEWYYGLVQPSWRAPDWAFGPAWTLIFTLAGYAGYQIWKHAETSAQRKLVIGLFALNSILNVGWSVLFFTLKRPDWALLEHPLLFLSIIALIIVFRHYHRSVVFALAPYALWVGFAGALNASIVELNGYGDLW